MKAQGSLIIVSAPSGTGKTSLVTALRSNMKNLLKSVSHTTRPARDGEENGVHYNFVTQEMFKSMLDQQVFLEHAEVFGNYYGTSRKWVANNLDNGFDVILEIDWQGAQQIRSQMDDSISIFILPPSKQALVERLTARNLDRPQIIAQRLGQAKIEVSHYTEYDYLIVNDNFDSALAELKAIITVARLRTTKERPAKQLLLDQLCSGA